MDMSLLGRLSHIKLPSARSLLPLFEAVVNSIHGIEDLNLTNGRIDIYIQRSSQRTLSDGEKNTGAAPAIIGFTIQDNGSGFNDTNLESFKKADSTLKIEKGGKGVGRFLWLIAFRKAEIESVYENAGQCLKRTFDFVVSESGVENETNEPAPDCAEANDRQTHRAEEGLRRERIQDGCCDRQANHRALPRILRPRRLPVDLAARQGDGRRLRPE